jgi:TRAP-type C4-dicarboxylate transport system permease small subunit
MGVIDRFGRLLDGIDRAFAAASGVCMFAIMLVVVADVALRYLFNSPLAWSYDVISLYLMVGMFFFGVSDTLRGHGHVAIDLVQKRMSPAGRHAGESIGYALTTIVAAAIAAQAHGRLTESWAADEVMAGAYDWPTWLAMAPVAAGAAMLTVRAAFRTVGHALSVLTREPLVELPPLSDTALSATEEGV